MLTATASVETEKASRYLVQLCKHFAHKVPAEWTDTTGHVQLPPGDCRLTVDGNTLTMVCEAKDAEGLSVAKHIVEDHLVRFAWREELSVTWE